MSYPRAYNAAVDFVDRHVTEGRGDKTAFVDPERTLTYRELQGATARVAGVLRARGLRREDRVAMLVLDTVDFPAIFWGAIRAGIVPVALNTLLTADQYAYILADSRARALLVSLPLLEKVAPVLDRLPALETVLLVGAPDDAPASGGHPSFAHALATQPEDPQVADTCADEVAFWLYSSGSTGMPKGVMHVHTSLMDTARLYGEGVLGIREDDTVFSAAKLFFAYGLGNGMSFPMAVGATTVLLPGRPTPDAVYDVLARHEPTIYYGVPTLYAAMLAHPRAADAAAPRLRLCVSAGEALPEQVGIAWRARFGVDILDGVGSTEMLHIYLSNQPGDVVYGTSGVAVPGYELRLVDETGAEVPCDEVGELLVKAPSAASAYWNLREKTRGTFEGAWSRTGDKFTRDADGRYHYCGRTDDMFKVSGIWVAPFEVESALVAHESVLEAAVVPAEDDDRLLKPKAFVVLKADGAGDAALAAALAEHVKSSIGTWKYPRWIEFVDELPKTATGKIQRFKLRD